MHFKKMRRGANTKVPAVRPPPQSWLANCLHPTRVVTVSSVNKAVGVEAVTVAGGGDCKTAGGAGGAGSKAGGAGDRGTKRGRGEGSGAKFEVTEQDGFIWVQCDDCSKWCVRAENGLLKISSRDLCPLHFVVC